MYLIAPITVRSAAHGPPSLALPLGPATAASLREAATRAREMGLPVSALVPGIRSCALRLAPGGAALLSEDGPGPAPVTALPGHAVIAALPPLPQAFWADERNDISVRGVTVDPDGTVRVFAWAEHDIVFMTSGGLDAQHLLD